VACKCSDLLSYNREPSPGADPGSASLPRTRGRRSEGLELGKRDSDAHLKVSRTRGLPLPHSPSEPSPGATPGWNGVQGHPGRWTQGHVRSPGIEPGSTWPSTKPVFQLRHERMRAATRCRPGPSAVRRRSRSRARRRAAPHGFEPRFAASGTAVLPFRRKGIEYGRRESNAHAASFWGSQVCQLPSLPHRAPPGI
jgi:hypothetical protein